MQRLETKAIRTQIQPSKAKKTKIINTHNAKRTGGQSREQLALSSKVATQQPKPN